jgi:peptidoglycan/LPS O-acetylase OafA/YrhL
LLWREVGYFDSDSATKPMLHLWSLGVEEQFLSPLADNACCDHAQRRMARFASVALLGAASLILSTVIATSHSAANFYLLPSRFWELLAGGALAMTVSPFVSHASDGTAPTSIPPVARELFSALGVILMVLGFVLKQLRPHRPMGIASSWPHWRSAGPDAFVNQRI